GMLSQVSVTLLPQECTESEALVIEDQEVQAIVASAYGNEGETISAGIILGDLHFRSAQKKKRGTLVLEMGDKGGEEELRKKLEKGLLELYSEYEKSFALQNIRFYTKEVEVTKKHGSCVVALAFAGFQQDLLSHYNSFPNFLGKKSAYEEAKYVMVPVPYEGRAPKVDGVKSGASALLEGSQQIEDYDILTDRQVIKMGIHTAPFLDSPLDSADLVQKISRKAEALFHDHKFPIFLGGDPILSAGVFPVLQNFYTPVTILHLDSHCDLRASFNGNAFDRSCVMQHAFAITNEVVQVGIRSMTNQEKNVLQYEKVFFASDIHENDTWLDDVLEEVKPHVYVTLDVNVFDPTIASSERPDPGGLSYHQVFSLLKRLARDRKVVGFDVVGLKPQPGNKAPEITLAKLIYQFISLIEAYRKDKKK
ncbi:MAG: arginase family protein, partial [Verrucomicrobia bacterium]|nr:arginase family protein [Verrucomicrobiota bacterium]